MKSMKIIEFILLLLFGTAAVASLTATETPLNVKAIVTNAVSPWYYVNADNAGVAISVTAGSCKVEVAFEALANCKDNTAIAFDWDGVNSVVNNGNKKFINMNGISCVRANCTSGTGTFLLRRH
jgi:hypothetical protein